MNGSRRNHPKETTMTKPTEAEVNAALDGIGEALRATGVTLEELIETGREIRWEIIKEKYGLAEVVPDERADQHRENHS